MNLTTELFTWSEIVPLKEPTEFLNNTGTVLDGTNAAYFFRQGGGDTRKMQKNSLKNTLLNMDGKRLHIKQAG
ncbi:MAG: hypothetical protein IJ601_04575 [Acidaminococcaceae bacterium]|nr:hypothetical protein [Acidaminococcaceae bacterium]